MPVAPIAADNATMGKVNRATAKIQNWKYSAIGECATLHLNYQDCES
jgi:hypothetical protein